MVQPQAKAVGISKMLRVELRISFHRCIKDSARGVFREVWIVHSSYV